MEKKWFVFYTKSRQEKKVNELLLKRGFEPFLPMQAIVRQWSDRKKKVVVPLFNSDIFVCVEEHRTPEYVDYCGVFSDYGTFSESIFTKKIAYLVNSL